MSLELTLLGDEVMESKTHVGYLHRGFEKLMERRRFINNFPLVCPDLRPRTGFQRVTAMQPPWRNWPEWKYLRTPFGSEPLFWKWPGSSPTSCGWGGQAGSLGMGVVGQWTLWARDKVLDMFERAFRRPNLSHLHYPRRSQKQPSFRL